jgi:site-specific DNA-methyltransferase (adenine-specific)
MDDVSCLGVEEFLRSVPDESTMLLWTDPPFGTGQSQALHSTWTGTDRLEYLDGSVVETLVLVDNLAKEALRILHPSGTLALLLDYRAIHDAVGIVREAGLVYAGEIIYHFELGGVSRKWWTNKHNTIALFTKGNPKFHLDQVPTVVRRAPRGAYDSEVRRVNSVWNYTMGPIDKERTGYPNQKPLAIVEPFVKVHTDPGDLCVDPFCGSGVVGEAAKNLDRRFLINDSSTEAVAVTRVRLGMGPTPLVMLNEL